MAEVDQVLANAAATALLAIAAAIGGKVRSSLEKKKRETNDLEAAREKIRAIQDRLGMPPAPLCTIDQIHAEIRKIHRVLETWGRGGSGDK